MISRFKVYEKCQRSKRAGGLPLGKASGKARPAPAWSFFHPTVISFRKYSGRPHNRERGDQLGLNIQWTILPSEPVFNQVYNFGFFILPPLSWVAGLRSGNFAVSGSAQDPFFRAGSISRGSWRPRIGRNPHSWLFLAPPIPIWVSLGPVTSLILANCPSGRFGAFSEQFSALQSSIQQPPTCLTDAFA